MGIGCRLREAAFLAAIAWELSLLCNTMWRTMAFDTKLPGAASIGVTQTDCNWSVLRTTLKGSLAKQGGCHHAALSRWRMSQNL